MTGRGKVLWPDAGTYSEATWTLTCVLFRYMCEKAEELRQQILELTAQYHAAKFPVREFVPGTSTVQVSGKVRDRLTVAADVSEDDLRAMALASEAVLRALDGREVRTVVIRAPKLVNVVPV